ncbi:MAG: DNA-binding response regulator [Frankiales bacterium]|nr:DNA-binding response regulator [Frankiales bacterium]
MTRVLLVDDDATLLRALSINLKARSYDVQAALTGAAGLLLAAKQPPDLVVLDLGLPDMDGTDVIAGLRGWTQVPILVLSARDGQAAKVAALDAGADDYVVKPFGMDELLARMRAALRRAAGEQGQPVVVTPDFTVDLAAKRVERDGVEVRLTATEWHLLELLARHANRTVEHRRLLEQVWGPAYVDQANYLRVYIAALRRKLEPDPRHPRYLITASGLGYRFDA